jgi:hypothetical protein
LTAKCVPWSASSWTKTRKEARPMEEGIASELDTLARQAFDEGDYCEHGLLQRAAAHLRTLEAGRREALLVAETYLRGKPGAQESERQLCYDVRTAHGVLTELPEILNPDHGSPHAPAPQAPEESGEPSKQGAKDVLD